MDQIEGPGGGTRKWKDYTTPVYCQVIIYLSMYLADIT